MQSFVTMDGHPHLEAIAITVVSLGFLLWRHVRHRLETKKPFEDLPMPAGGHWFFGHLVFLEGDFQTALPRLMLDHANKYGQTGFWILNTRMVSVTHWQDARTILHSEYSRKRVPNIAWHISRFLGPRNLGLLNGREWKHHRSAVLRSFGPHTVAKSHDAILTVTKTLVAAVKHRLASHNTDTTAMDVEQLMKMITIDVFGKTALSCDLECCENLRPSPIAISFDFLGSELSRRLSQPLSISNWVYCLPTRANCKHREAKMLLRSFLAQKIQQRRESDPCEDSDMLSNLISAQDTIKSQGGQDEQTLSDIMMTLLFAGYDTTSITLTYALYCLSQHPTVEQLCVEEIQNVGLDSCDKLVYCRAVIYETLRLYPPGNATLRTLQKPVQLRGGAVVPAGTSVFVPIWLLHRDETVFPRAEAFRPDRWVRRDNTTDNTWIDRDACHTDEDSSCSIMAANRNAFFAFSAGARSCAGVKFAMQEAVLSLAVLLKELKFQAVPGYKLRPVRCGIVQHPEGGMPMQISVRCES